MLLNLHTMIDLIMNGLKNQFLIDDDNITIEETKYQNNKLQLIFNGEDKKHIITFKLEEEENDKNYLKIMWCDYQLQNDWDNITSFTASGFVSMTEILNIFYGVYIMAGDVLEVVGNVA